MFGLLLVVLLVPALVAQEAKELRPCFERYANHRLVNLQPFHSEWRMRTEDHCLRFCALSASRCRSIVFDSVQHICHYFLDEGRDSSVPASKMIYLRVASKECLDGMGQMAAEIPEVTTESVVQPTTEATLVPMPTLIPEPVTEEMPREEVGFAGSFDNDIPDNNEVRRDIEAPVPQDRWQSSMEKVVKNNEELSFKPNKQPVEEVSAEMIMENKKNLEEKLKQRLEMLQNRFPDKYVEFIGDSAEVKTTSTTTTTTEQPRTKPRRISFKENVMVPKKLTFNGGDVRRKPARPELKPVGLDASAVALKARMFLDSVNGEAEVEQAPVATTLAPVPTQNNPPHPAGNGCDDETAVWVTFENSLDREQPSIDSSFMQSKEECQEMCNGMEECRSFSFFEKDSQCQINVNSEGVKLKASPGEDFSASTSTRFCYGRSLVPFQGCTNFIGFRDLSLQVAPREQFDGLPKGYEGMKLCIELCVLSSDYTCRSASFLVAEGRCLLNEEDSLTEPDLFKSTPTDDHLYFENACSSPSSLSPAAKSETSIERVPLPKSTLKQLQIKPIKSRSQKINYSN